MGYCRYVRPWDYISILYSFCSYQVSCIFLSSRDCQRKDYANHKAVCREIGQAKLKPSTLDMTTTYRSSVLQRSTTQATFDAYKQLAIKGRPAPVESLSNVFGRFNREIKITSLSIVNHRPAQNTVSQECIR